MNKRKTPPSFKIIECLRDKYLAQHVNSSTRYRKGQDPSCEGLIPTDDDVII